MKSWYAAAFIVTALIMYYYIIKAGKSKKKIAATVRKLLMVSVMAVAANLVLMLSETKEICMAAYSVFFICIDWISYGMLRFSIEYTGCRIHKYLNRLFIGALILDSLSLAANLFFHHAFTCTQIVLENGELYYRLMTFAPYQIHMLLCYLLFAVSFGFLIYKTCKSPAFYRIKYLLILLVILTVILGDAVYVFMNTVIDGSILGFAAAGIIIYHYAVAYLPKKLLHSTLSLVVKGSGNAILIFDIDGNCIYQNERAKKLMDAQFENPQQIEEIFAYWYEKKDLKTCGSGSSDRTKMINGKEVHLKVTYQSLLDNDGNYLGSFLLIQDRTEEVNALEKQRYLATHDRLTGLYNKEYFYECIESRLREHTKEQFLLMCSDVKNFKIVNDMFGTDTGDHLLRNIANVLKEQNAPGEIYGRLENDRFGLFLRKADYREEIFEDAPKEVTFADRGISFPVNIYSGVYEIMDRTMPVSVMCDRAFMAVDTIKGNYQKKIAFYDDTLRENVLREQKLTGEAQEALKKGQFQMYLQPQITAGGEVSGAEVLVRWAHPKKGIIMPGSFIEIFEKNGMIVKLDQYMWELACIQLKKWREQGRKEMYLSINISPKDIYFMDVYKIITALTEKYQISPANLKIEITETAVMENLEKELLLIEKLRAAGFVVEMDDFGSGYSSLNMLKDIQVDVLKIDMKFLEKTKDGERGRKILKMIVGLSEQLGMPVIMEGVETKEQVDFLKGIGCDMFQGYYFAKPMEVGAFEEQYMGIGA